MNENAPESSEPLNHRTRVGQERRQKMRMRLMESALMVFAKKGIDAAVIEDVIAEAGVARGTFYNYFQTTSELVAALGELLSNELIDQIEDRVGELDDPVEILATGLRLFLHVTRQYPNFARYVVRAGPNIDAAGHLIYAYLPRHIARSIERGAFEVVDAMTALEVIVGIMFAAAYGISTRTPEQDYPERMVRHVLVALGVKAKEVSRLTQLPLPALALPADSLLVKTHQ